MNEEEEESPLGKKLDKVTHQLTWIGIIYSPLTFIVLLIFWKIDVAYQRENNMKFNGVWMNNLVQQFMVGVTILICVVTEALPLDVTLSLGCSMKRMMKDNKFCTAFAFM
jgi:Ca2+-transporting ATPase